MKQATILAAFVAAGAIAASAAQGPRYDVILRGGTLIDGTGAPPAVGDLAISEGAIVALGDIGDATADVELDVNGLYVTPGFINIHSHPTPAGLRRAENMLTQGVTTEVVNPDGGGPLDVGRQLAELEASGLALNVGANIGFNSIWADVVGEGDRRPTDAERERMRRMIVSGLEAGAFGVSSGLDYKPAYFATTEEVTGIVSAAAPWRTIFTNHDRLTPESNYSSRAGITETLGIGRRSGLVPVVTHMKAQGHEQGTGQALIDLIARSAAPDGFAAADVYPYLAGQSGLGALIIPGWAQEGGREAMLARFKDPAQRARIVAESEEAMRLRFGGPSGVFVTGIDRELTDVMRDLGGVSAGEAVVRTLEGENRGAILRFGAEADQIAILRGRDTSIACDCGATEGRASHPRFYGAFPRVLGRYVREQGVLRWEDAVRKMTGLPASTIGLVDRGFLAAGMAADVTVFDPATVIDHATFEAPTLPSDGIRHVLVNGRFALRDGAVTGTRAGQALRRGPQMPSRPTRFDRARRLAVRGTVDEATIDVGLRAPAGARGTGQLRVTAPDGTRYDVEVGLLQTAPGWAGLTGVALVEGRPRAVRLLVDADDPLAPGSGPRVALRIAGLVDTAGRLAGTPPVIEP